MRCACAFSAALLLGLLAGFPAAGQAITEYRLPELVGEGKSITTGPDGNLWLLDGFIPPLAVLRVDANVRASRFSIDAFECGVNFGCWTAAIAPGSDGNLWVTSAIGAYRVTTGGVFSLVVHESLGPIAPGSDGNLWAGGGGPHAFARITPAGVITYFPLTGGSPYVRGVVAGPDGNIWFTKRDVLSYTNDSVGRVTPDGQVTEFRVPPSAYPWAITVGQDGNLWFTAGRNIGRMTPDGTFSIFPLPSQWSYANAITTGPDGNVWFNEYGESHIGRITPAGVITELSIPSGGRASAITTGPDGALWFTENGPYRLGRIDVLALGAAPASIPVLPRAALALLGALLAAVGVLLVRVRF